MEKIPAQISGFEPFRCYFEASMRANFSPTENQQYLDDMVTENDIRNGLREAKERARAEGVAEGREEGRAEGREEGRAEGREEGKAEGRYEVAKTMLASGAAVELISKYTGLSAEQVKAI